MSGICRNCGKEAATDSKLGLGPICLKKHGVRPETRKPKEEVLLKINKIDLSRINNTYDIKGTVEEAPLDLTLHYALEEAGYDDYNRENEEECFNIATKTLFTGDRLPVEFKKSLNEIGFEVKGFLPRLKCSPGNFTNLVVGTKEGRLDMLLRVYANYDNGILFFRTNPQYVLLSPDEDDLLISLREEVFGDSSEGASDFNYFLAKIGKQPYDEYLANFPVWLRENCDTKYANEKKNIYSYANTTASKTRGNEYMKNQKKLLSKKDLKFSACLSPEEKLSPLRISILKEVGQDRDLANPEELLIACYDVEIYTYDLYHTKLGRAFGHINQAWSLSESPSVVRSLKPEGPTNDLSIRLLKTAIDLCFENGVSQKDTDKAVKSIYKRIHGKDMP